MPEVLTNKSTLKCAHQGKVQLIPSQTKLIVAGASVLVDGDLPGKALAGCTTAPPPQTNVPCLTVASAMGGLAAKLVIGGKKAILKTVQGGTSGTVGGTPQTWSVQDPGQSKLKAV